MIYVTIFQLSMKTPLSLEPGKMWMTLKQEGSSHAQVGRELGFLFKYISLRGPQGPQERKCVSQKVRAG